MATLAFCRLGQFLSFLLITVSFSLTYWLFYDYPTEIDMTYCSVMSPTNFTRMNFFMSSSLTVEILAVIIFNGLLYINRKRKSDTSTLKLAARYQLTENINTLTMCIPLACCHFAVVFSICITYKLRIKFQSFFMDDTTFEELVSHAEIYGCLIPIVGLIEYRLMQKRKRRVMAGNFVNVRDHMEKMDALTIAHFRVMRNVWN
ncbi:unnamed protein product [Caenorhabditis auriculariae]|uniref:Uncharacterized protein n=1 Tax=Caenorhabditis auriculariae TaxID=2777116 RepID=A0A8S1HFK7_9PELO|nr:unnamed protein product [Caenorhabditis auriculariae]